MVEAALKNQQQELAEATSAMPQITLTGMSGVGKSTLLERVLALSRLVAKATQKKIPINIIRNKTTREPRSQKEKAQRTHLLFYEGNLEKRISLFEQDRQNELFAVSFLHNNHFYGIVKEDICPEHMGIAHTGLDTAPIIDFESHQLATSPQIAIIGTDPVIVLAPIIPNNDLAEHILRIMDREATIEQKTKRVERLEEEERQLEAMFREQFETRSLLTGIKNIDEPYKSFAKLVFEMELAQAFDQTVNAAWREIEAAYIRWWEKNLHHLETTDSHLAEIFISTYPDPREETVKKQLIGVEVPIRERIKKIYESIKNSASGEKLQFSAATKFSLIQQGIGLAQIEAAIESCKIASVDDESKTIFLHQGTEIPGSKRGQEIIRMLLSACVLGDVVKGNNTIDIYSSKGLPSAGKMTFCFVPQKGTLEEKNVLELFEEGELETRIAQRKYWQIIAKEHLLKKRIPTIAARSDPAHNSYNTQTIPCPGEAFTEYLLFLQEVKQSLPPKQRTIAEREIARGYSFAQEAHQTFGTLETLTDATIPFFENEEVQDQAKSLYRKELFNHQNKEGYFQRKDSIVSSDIELIAHYLDATKGTLLNAQELEKVEQGLDAYLSLQKDKDVPARIMGGKIEFITRRSWRYLLALANINKQGDRLSPRTKEKIIKQQLQLEQTLVDRLEQEGPIFSNNSVQRFFDPSIFIFAADYFAQTERRGLASQYLKRVLDQKSEYYLCEVDEKKEGFFYGCTIGERNDKPYGNDRAVLRVERKGLRTIRHLSPPTQTKEVSYINSSPSIIEGS